MAGEDQVYALQMRLTLLERKLNYLFQALNIADPEAGWAAGSDPLAAQIAALLRQGQKLQAIALYRRETGGSLSDAKRAVEAIEQGM